MKKALFLVCGLLVTATAVPLYAAKLQGPLRQIQPVPSGPKIKVLLEKDVSSALLEVKGSYRVIRKDSGTILSYGGHGKRFVAHALQDGLRWGEEYPDVYQISIIPLNEDTAIYVNGIQYKGMVSVYHVRDNHITVVTEVTIEDFLKSTLTVKYNNPLNKEAMAALVIAARTDAYGRVLSGKSAARPWDVTAEESDYYGYGVTLCKQEVEEMVDWTRFMVLESTKQGGPLQNMHLSASKAEELAKLGLDANKILKSSFPHAKLGVTIDADEVAIR